MDFLHSVLLLAHLIGAAALVGGWLATFRSPTVLRWQLIGAWIQLISGVLMVGLAEMNEDAGPVNNAKIGVKLLILVIVLVAAIIGRRKVARGEDVPVGIAHSVGGLALVNMAIAALW